MMDRQYCCSKGTLIGLALLLLICGCGGQGAAFRDDFEDQRGDWASDQREHFDRGYAEGEYFIELHDPNWFAWSNPGAQFDDVSVEVNAYLSAGSQDGHCGVLCRYADADSFYYFAISADGYYGIFGRKEGGGLDVLSGNGDGMTFSPLIRTGGQTNSIRAICQGNELSLYVNGELLETVEDGTHSEGDVGLGVGSGPQGDTRVQFDDFAATRP
jgi:hypothetical protein